MQMEFCSDGAAVGVAGSAAGPTAAPPTQAMADPGISPEAQAGAAQGSNAPSTAAIGLNMLVPGIVLLMATMG